MQTLSNVPFEELRVGDRVKSKTFNLEGVITYIYKDEESSMPSNNQIMIIWENNSFDIGCPDEYNKIWLM